MSNKLTVQQAIKQDLARMKDQFKHALPNHIPVDKFVRTIQTAVATTPALAKADRQSLFGAAMKAAQDGLLPDGKEAAIVTFGDKAQYMPMVGGILKKVRNSGELASITAQIVYKNDDFEFYVDEDGEHLKHRPEIFTDRGAEIGVYALAKTKDGSVYIEVMTNDELEKIKAVSRGKGGPWSGPFASEMKKKSAIRRLAKRLPMSTDLDFTIRADDELYDFEKPHEIELDADDVDRPEPKDVTAPQTLNKMLADEETKDVEQKEVPI